MKIAVGLLLLSLSGLASAKHILMVSDSRGNCAFAHKMIRNFYSLDNTTFRLVSAGGSAPSAWMEPTKRFLSPYGLDKSGSSNAVPAKFPKALSLKKTRVPYFPNLLKQEAEGKADFLTIINMGTNAYDSKLLKQDAIKMIKEVHKVGGSCAWVSPPHAQGFPLEKIQGQTNAIAEAIREAGVDNKGEHCKLINSLELTHYPFTYKAKGIDGVHYCWNPELVELGYKWADDAFEQIKE